MTSVRLDQVSKHFGSTIALHPIDLNIAAGELFFLLGPSGCGKSTLLRIIAGLHEPTHGRVLFNDRDVTREGTEKRNAVMCFQSYALWPHMTVRENVRFGLEVRKLDKLESKRRVDEALSLVRMDQLADRKPNQLSGGQQQRVALARALVVRPDCLLLDEPLSNLDAKLRLEMRGEIRRICRAAKLTAVYVTHDQKEALSIADRMAVLNAGVIEQIGSPQELYLLPKNKFVAGFMGETNFIEGRVLGTVGEGVAIETAVGPIVAARSDDIPSAGTSVSLSVRPESIRIGTMQGTNRFAATLHDTIYLGEVAQHRVTLDNVLDLRAFELNPRTIARDSAVEHTHIAFDPQDVIVLPAAESRPVPAH